MEVVSQVLIGQVNCMGAANFGITRHALVTEYSRPPSMQLITENVDMRGKSTSAWTRGRGKATRVSNKSQVKLRQSLATQQVDAVGIEHLGRSF